MTTPSISYIEQTAGRGAARAAGRRRRNDHDVARRPGWVTYVVLTVVALISIFPLYYTFLLASSTPAEVAQNPIPAPTSPPVMTASIEGIVLKQGTREPISGAEVELTRVEGTTASPFLKRITP